MFTRTLSHKVQTALENTPAVAILGPRQVGKTTLALGIAKNRPSLYLDLENAEDIQKLTDPGHYLGLHADKLVILDEIQRYPDLFLALRGVIDAGRRSGQGNGRFLLLGSASNDLIKQSSESLAGRISYLELQGLNPFEIEPRDSKHIEQLWTRGGFPECYAASSDVVSAAWRKDFIRTYLERDIPQLGPRVPAATLMRFWTMLAHGQGELLNASKLATSLGIKSVTISRYLDLMVDLLLARRLEPWHGNVKKRLVKTPRTYVRDSGIVHSLLQIPDYDGLLGHPIVGKSWEGFVIEQILGALPSHVHPFFYRTSAGAEIDLLLEIGLDDYWAIEIKLSRTPQVQNGFHLACQDLAVKRKYVVYSGEDTFSLGETTTAISLPLMLQELQNYLT